MIVEEVLSWPDERKFKSAGENRSKSRPTFRKEKTPPPGSYGSVSPVRFARTA